MKHLRPWLELLRSSTHTQLVAQREVGGGKEKEKEKEGKELMHNCTFEQYCSVLQPVHALMATSSLVRLDRLPGFNVADVKQFEQVSDRHLLSKAETKGLSRVKRSSPGPMSLLENRPRPSVVDAPPKAFIAKREDVRAGKRELILETDMFQNGRDESVPEPRATLQAEKAVFNIEVRICSRTVPCKSGLTCSQSRT